MLRRGLELSSGRLKRGGSLKKRVRPVLFVGWGAEISSWIRKLELKAVLKENNKPEARNPNFETISNVQNPKHQGLLVWVA